MRETIDLDQFRTNGRLLKAVIGRNVALRKHGPEWVGLCPFHAENTPSFTIYDDGHFYCFGCQSHGNIFDWYMQRENLDFPHAKERVLAEAGAAVPKQLNGKLNGNGKHIPPDKDIASVYDYRDEAGTTVVQAIRTISGDPRFRQRHPNGRGGWAWNGIDNPPLYREPALRAAAPGTLVWLCEGEKDVERLTEEGLIATTNISGAGNWKRHYAQVFKGLRVVVLEDNDEAGRKRCARIAKDLAGLATAVKVLRLKGLGAGEDVSDWLDRGGTVEELERLGQLEPEAETPALRLRYGFDATHAEPLGTIVEGLLHAGSLTLIYGPPKSGKSFLVTDMALSVSAGLGDWMGHSIIRPGPILYVACEGHAGFWKRLIAATKERGWDRATFPSGFILATGRPMLIRADARGQTYAPDPSSILVALADAKRRGLNPVGIVIDTVFRSFGVGNVNASPDMNVYLACVAVLTDQGYAAALVHHEIKSGGTPAGSVSLIGGADTIVHVWREDEASTRRFWQVEMAKDDAETEPRGFVLDIIPIGTDPEGRPATSCVVRDGGAMPDAKALKKRGRPPSENSDAAILASLIHTELCNLLADNREGESIPIHPESQPIRAVTRLKLRATINQAGILDAVTDEADRKRVTKGNDKQVERAINRLKKQGKISTNETWIGLA